MADDVRKIQQALALCGFFPGEVDGLMGPNTKAALTKFQQASGLAADGIMGPNSKKALVAKLGEASAQAVTLAAELSI